MQAIHVSKLLIGPCHHLYSRYFLDILSLKLIFWRFSGSHPVLICWSASSSLSSNFCLHDSKCFHHLTSVAVPTRCLLLSLWLSTWFFIVPFSLHYIGFVLKDHSFLFSIFICPLALPTPFFLDRNNVSSSFCVFPATLVFRTN